MTARIQSICDAIAAYVTANRTTLPLLIASVQSAPVTYHMAESSQGPMVFVYPIASTHEQDTREDYRTTYGIGVTVSSLLATAADDELRALQTLVEGIRNLLRDVAQGGAEFWSINAETSQPSFSVEDEMQGQYYVSTVALDYVDFA